MIFLLDTDTLIYLIKHKPATVAGRVDALDENARLGMSFVSFAELLKGAERSNRKDDVLARLERLTRQVPVIYETGRALCEHYAVQATRLREAGTPISANDLWIGCHALALDATLVTNNQREFARIAGLRLDNWVA
ncbi:MAG: type II toxin-antitoxin system VapC family toxin [Rhodocyclales bacterium]|nr:type II toxin-antitoxin system VapC family toxin [Rhodocyclales bacterium]